MFSKRKRGGIIHGVPTRMRPFLKELVISRKRQSIKIVTAGISIKLNEGKVGVLQETGRRGSDLTGCLERLL